MKNSSKGRRRNVSRKFQSKSKSRKRWGVKRRNSSAKRWRGSKGRFTKRRSNPGMSLVKVFDVPAKLVGKVPVLGKYVKPVVVPLLFGAGGALVLGALTKATLRFMPEQIQPFAYTTAGVLGSVGLGILTKVTKGRILDTKSMALLAGVLPTLGAGVDLFRHFVLRESADAELSGLAIDDMSGLAIDAGSYGAPGPAYDVIPASTDSYSGLAIEEYGDASLADAYGCPGDLGGDEIEALNLGGWRNWFSRFGQSPRSTSRMVNGPSRHCGTPGHQWGWLVKIVGPDGMRQLATMDAGERQQFIGQMRQSAATALSQAQQQEAMGGLAVDLQGLAIDTQSYGGIAAGAAY